MLATGPAPHRPPADGGGGARDEVDAEVRGQRGGGRGAVELHEGLAARLPKGHVPLVDARRGGGGAVAGGVRRRRGGTFEEELPGVPALVGLGRAVEEDGARWGCEQEAVRAVALGLPLLGQLAFGVRPISERWY